jgi:uncharacterized cupin superfamily protein
MTDDDLLMIAKGAPGTWTVQDGEDHWQLFRNPDGMGHPMQVIKAPKESDLFAPYWPTESEATYILTALNALPELVADKIERKASFDLRWKADQRAIRMWQKATGRTEVWPDHADLCVWLLGRLAAAELAQKNDSKDDPS